MTHLSGAQISYKMRGNEHLIRDDIMEAQKSQVSQRVSAFNKKKSEKVRMRMLITWRGHVQKRGALLVSPGRGMGSEEFGWGPAHETSLCCLSCAWGEVTRDGIAEGSCQ